MPNNNNTDRWMEVAKWAGESEAAIKGLNKEVSGLRKDIQGLDRKVSKLNDKLTGVQIKLAGASATIALIVTIVTAIIINSIG